MAISKDKTRVSVVIDNDAYKKMQLESILDGKTKSTIVNQALHFYFNNKEKGLEIDN